ncbi:phospholipase effector Tle1 domain-containing protein [Asticcacaulis solisilvae]|uniref:phospholipase effector Tle1 domain-containing protein n=1 Tax=Asticcacaulis solisilvae TaxID=1217274 RepID=UPI003FD7822A
MTIHVVCLDGTDQEKTQKYPTNIAKIFDSIGGQAADADYGSFECSHGGISGKYLPGVGTQGSDVLKALGGLFGDGIAELIVRGYTYLSRQWQPGDEIVLTGFSRGATAARALAGLITGRGLLDQAAYDATDKEAAYRRAVAAWYLYRSADASLADQARLGVMKMMLGKPLPKLTDAAFQPPAGVKAVAVFDTVSSLGLPNFHNGTVRFDFSICNTTLSDKVEYGFHALSADEMRDIFSPTFWAPRDKVTQLVFPGCHSNVGGGFPDKQLSDVALTWMLDSLGGIGIALDRGLITEGIDPNALGLIQDDGRRPPFFGVFCRGRAFPADARPHQALKERLNKVNRITPALPGPYKPAGTYAGGVPLV